MAAEKNEPKPPKNDRIGLLLKFCILAVGLWAANWIGLWVVYSKLDERGQFGDMFGAVNALFTALAFAGLIYTALLQQDQLALQQKEIFESGETQKKLVAEQIDAQKALFECQKKFQEEQRILQNAHEVKLEGLRQEFEEIVENRRKDREIQAQKEFARNVVLAIRCELEALRQLYKGNIGEHLTQLKPGEELRVRFMLSEEWMTVFEANTVNLGKIDAILARKIIIVYALLKGLIEQFRINNECLSQEVQLLNDKALNPGTSEFQRRFQNLKEQMPIQAQAVLKADQHLEAAYHELIADLDRRGIK